MRLSHHAHPLCMALFDFGPLQCVRDWPHRAEAYRGLVLLEAVLVETFPQYMSG